MSPKSDRSDRKEGCDAGTAAGAGYASAASVLAFSADGRIDLPLDIDEAFSAVPQADIVADSAADGLVYSLTQLGRVDIGYISQLTGLPPEQIIAQLKGAIYQNPDRWDEDPFSGWETADEYLTGNLIRKRRAAEVANAYYRGRFAANISAINDVLPAPATPDDIYVTLGSPWVPPEVIDEFITHMFGCSRFGVPPMLHDEASGTWEVPCINRFKYNVRSYSTYGTRRLGALEILERTLNLKSVSVYDSVGDPNNRKRSKRVINRTETALAMEKQKFMIDEFKRWVWTSDARKKKLLEIFEEKYGSYRRRRYDGSFLTFPEMSPSVSLYPYQKNAVARILFSPNTLLAHDVGAGKTFIMIAAGMEAKRMKLAKRVLYVVPNNIVGQWRKIFSDLYPQANVLVVEPKTFTPSKRKAMLESIRGKNFDAVLMAHSCFDMIDLSKKYALARLRDERAALTKRIRDKSTQVPSELFRQRDRMTRKLADMQTAKGGEGEDIYFDALGIDMLFVDEAHHYKNVPVVTKIDRVLGISADGSKKCKHMLDAVRCVQRKTGGRGVIMATGTPITNSIADAFVFQQYLQSGELALLDLNCFDAWVGMFAERNTEFEVDVDTNSYRLATRFSRFHNLTELTALLAGIADFHRAEGENGLPRFDGYTDTLIPKSLEFAAYLKTISERADLVRHGKVKRTEDNMLKITGDGRRAALDLRLVDGDAPFEFQSKVMCCASNVAALYRKTSAFCGTQLVFCDSSTPKIGFNIYSELSRLLIGLGVKSDEIAYIHDAVTESKRASLFADVRAGRVRVLIGSTFKLGVGVNVQDRLIALHHLDVPWRPADMVQREGRIIRPGNTNARVFIFRYITEGSFDAYSWQLLETKQRFISALLAGACETDSGEDVDGTALSYAEVKALAIGNPLVKKRVELTNELARLSTLQSKLIENRERLGAQLASSPKRIAETERATEAIKDDMAFVANTEYELDKTARRELRENIFAAVSTREMMPTEREVAVYRGFRIVAPANMIKGDAFVFVRRSGSYRVPLGENAIGVLIRLDNCIDGLGDRLERAHNALEELKEQQVRLTEELNRDSPYADRIEQIKTEIEAVDKKLKVN